MIIYIKIIYVPSVIPGIPKSIEHPKEREREREHPNVFHFHIIHVIEPPNNPKIAPFLGMLSRMSTYPLVIYQLYPYLHIHV